jgi:hypothetical protein
MVVKLIDKNKSYFYVEAVKITPWKCKTYKDNYQFILIVLTNGTVYVLGDEGGKSFPYDKNIRLDKHFNKNTGIFVFNKYNTVFFARNESSLDTMLDIYEKRQEKGI